MAQEERGQIDPEITCQELVAWVSAYLDDHVGDERKRQIVLHLAICAGCETYVRQIATVRHMVRALPQAEDEPVDHHRLREAFVARASRLRSGS
ncbi:MAG: zf-HC2 domain-containing protein [Nitrospira sp.]|nr:zf-HC2 domain-containing protein [Nitrospira sp.]